MKPDASAYREPTLNVAIYIIATLAVFAALYVARALFIPVALACVLALVLAPIVRLLCKLGLPRAPASGGLVVAAMALVGIVFIQLSAPATTWFSRLPEAVLRLRYIFREVISAVQNLREFTKDLAQFSPGQADGDTVVQAPDLTQILLTNTGELVTMIVITAVLLYFLLANGYLFMLKTVHALPSFGEKKRAVEIGRDLQIEVSRYLLTITAINIALGCVTAVTMAALGLPDPLLWGVMATVLNFIPYAGAFLMALAVFLASLLTFGTLLDVMLPPIAFLTLTTLEGNLITPLLVGRRLTLNPVIVFTSLLFWGWIWGIAGLLLAVPLLVVLKILCDHIGPLQLIGEYLSSQPPRATDREEPEIASSAN